MNYTNKDLKIFFDGIYTVGEEKHFTNFLVTNNPSSESKEILKKLSWKNKSVLDVGCGTGLFSYLAAKKGAKVLGIDYSKKAISLALSNYSHKNLSYKCIDAKNMKNDKFDIIVSLGTLEHVDNPLQMLKNFKRHLNSNGKIIITSPNWTNPRGYMLLILYFLFDFPITLADLHYFTPIDFKKFAKKLDMTLNWNTFDFSWGNGDILVNDFKRRIPKILSDMKLDVNQKKINNLLKWIKNNVVPFDNKLPHGGASGIYIFSQKNIKT